MAEERNIIVLGGSAAGLMTAHNTMKHLLPGLKAKGDAKYHVYLINPSSKFYYRNASPRTAASNERLPFEKINLDINEGFQQYSKDDFTFIEAAATGLDTTARTVSYRRNKASDIEYLPYHALVVATGSRTHYPAFSQSGTTEEVYDHIKITNEKVNSAKDIVIVGGGPTAAEFAAEVAEHRNGKPGWFSNAERKVNITLVTSADRLLAGLRPAISQTAEQKLNALGVDVVYNTRITDAQERKDGRTIITSAKGDTLEADLYVPAYGVEPNSSWIQTGLLDENKFLKTDDRLRVPDAGARVYAIGDIGSYSRNNIWDILGGHPVLAVNMKRDLLSYDAMLPTEKPKGQDRIFKPETRESMVVPFGTTGGVGAVMGWRLPNWVVWLLKGRDYMLSMSGASIISGDSVKKEVVWTKVEAAI